MKDNEILELFWMRNQNAIVQISQKYGKMLHSIAYHILQNHWDSEEILNDTYEKVWNAIPPEKPNSLIAYLGRIARNLALNRWYHNHAQKRQQNEVFPFDELSECISSNLTIDSEVETTELTKIIEKWLQSLSKEERVLFIKRYWFCESLNTLAKQNNITANQLAGRMFRLRQSLKQKLAEEEIYL